MENYKNIGFLSNTGPDPLKITKLPIQHSLLGHRLGPRMKKIKNGYPESSKVCYGINLKMNLWCIRNHCIANFSELHNATRAKKVW